MLKEEWQKSALFRRLTAGYLACMGAVYLLYTGFGGYAQLTESKWKLFMLLSLAYLGLTALLALELCVIGRARVWGPARLWRALSGADKLILGFWACSALSTLCSVDPSTAFWGSGRREGLLTLTIYCLIALAAAHLAGPALWLPGVLGGAMCLNCVLCMLQLAGRNPLGLYPSGMDYYDAGRLYAGEFLGTLGNVDLLAAVLCVVIPLLWLALWKLRGRGRFLLTVPLALCLWVLWRSSVAAGFVGTFGALALTLPLLPSGRRARLVTGAAVAAACAAGLALVYVLGGRLEGFLYEASEVLHGRWQDEFGSSRVFIWRHVWELVPQRLLLGGGPDTLGLRMEVGFERYDEALGMVIRSSIDNAHNEYLNILVNQGLAALVCYLALLARSGAGWLRTAGRDPAAALWGGAVLGYCIQAFFGISSPISAPYFWIALGLLNGCLNRTAAGRTGERQEKV